MIIQSVTQIRSISRPRYLILLEILLDNYAYYLKIRSAIVEGYIISTVLALTYISISRFLRWYYNATIKIPIELLNIKNDRYIIVANHHRAIDPYLILATLPFNIYRTLLPIRFFTANVFLKHWWQRCFLLAFGSFRAYSTEGKVSGVKGGLQLSDREESLFIFPEGKRVKTNSKVDLKIGVAYLAQRREFTFIPVHVHYAKTPLRKETQISWGKPFKISHEMKSEDLNTLTKYIFNKVKVLLDRK